MKNILITCFLKINTYFPKKHHPFHDLKNGIHDLNYTDFEYEHAKQLVSLYKPFFDFSQLSGKKILEVGCGGGGKTIYISEKYNCQGVGIDLNMNFLTQAKNKAQEKNIENNVEFYSMDALSLDFQDNMFDMVLMSDVLEHIPSTQKLLDEVIRVTKKNGYILFDFAPYFHYFGHHMWDTIQIPWLHLFTTEKFRVDLYKKSVEQLPDKDKRIDLRIGLDKSGQQSFTYLNKIMRKDFESIMSHCEDEKKFKHCTISYLMLKNIKFFSKIPLLREMFIRHIVGVIQK